jgi:hypothetical protein
MSKELTLIDLKKSEKVRSLKEMLDLERAHNLADITRPSAKKSTSLWAYFRVYYAETLVLKKEAGVKVKRGMVRTLIKDVFYGNPLRIFRKPRFLAFIASDQRKEIDGEFVHPLDLLPKSITQDLLMVELPYNRKSKISKVPSRFVLSAYVLILLETLVGFFIPKRKFTHLFAYDTIELLLGASISRVSQARRFYSCYWLTKIMLKLWNRPEMVFCCAPYPFMGRIVALKEAGIPIIEIQHGCVSSSHRAYNVPRNYGRKFYPDYFLSWGDYEKHFFSNKDNFYLAEGETVLPVGNFYIDYLLKNTSSYKRELIRSSMGNENTLVAVSLQDPLEDYLMPFILEAARYDNSFSFLLLPRAKSHQFYRETYDLPGNVFLEEKINTYQGIIAADFHTTIWSTTAIEAVVLGKTNVLVDLNGMATGVIGELLDKDRNTFYAETATLMVTLLRELRKDQKNKENNDTLFHHEGVKENIAKAVKKITELTRGKEGGNAVV